MRSRRTCESSGLTRLSTLVLLVVSVLALSWNPEPSSPIPAASLHVSWSGWPFVCKQINRNLSPNGGSQIVHSKYAKPELWINGGVAVAIVTLLYFGLTRFAFKSFPRFTLMDVLSLTVGFSIAIAYFTANPDTFLWNLRFVLDDGSLHSKFVLQRPLWQNGLACILIVLAGYSGTLMLFSGTLDKK